MVKLYLQSEAAAAVGRTHQAITYAVARRWISPYGDTGRGQLLFTEESIRSYAELRGLEVDFSRLEAKTA